jgi:hypothetical protein
MSAQRIGKRSYRVLRQKCLQAIATGSNLGGIPPYIAPRSFISGVSGSKLKPHPYTVSIRLEVRAAFPRSGIRRELSAASLI